MRSFPICGREPAADSCPSFASSVRLSVVGLWLSSIPWLPAPLSFPLRSYDLRPRPELGALRPYRSRHVEDVGTCGQGFALCAIVSLKVPVIVREKVPTDVYSTACSTASESA